MKVLVIDDSKFQRAALCCALRKAGHEVITAGDGEEGLRVARESHPEIILLDMLLPKLSGVEVLRILKQEQQNGPPVVVLSALSEKNCDKLMEEGAAGYVEKSAALLQGNCKHLLSLVAQLCRSKAELLSHA